MQINISINLDTNKNVRIKSAQRLRCRYDNAPDAAPAAKAEDASNEAAPAKELDRSERRATGAKPLSLLDSAAKILSEDGEARNCKQLVEQATERGLWTPRAGKTPSNTLYAAITREIKVKGEASRFTKADRGKFAPAGKA